MGRWEPGSSERLREAAMDLYVEHGFEQTTVAEIAERAGVTSRTFFRYFADKREVLFAGSEVLREHLLATVAAAPDDATTMEVVWAGLVAASEVIGLNHEFARRRQGLIVATAELQERELIKLSTLAEAVAEQLRARGVREPEASVAAHTGLAVLRVGFERWVDGPANRKLVTTMRQAFDQLAVLTAQP